MQMVNYVIHYTLCMRRGRERHQKISREVGNLERTTVNTNKMRDMSKRPN